MANHPKRSRKPSKQQLELLRYVADQGGAITINEAFNRRTAWSLVDKGLLDKEGSVGVYAGKTFSGLTFCINDAGRAALE